MLLSNKMENKSGGTLVRKKRSYGKLSLDQKIQIIRAAEMGYSQRTLASQYNCGKTQIHLLVTQKDLWLSKWERSRKGGNWSKIHETVSTSEINSLVWDFYKKASTHDIDVSVNMLLERAKQVANSLNVHNFEADYEWLLKFKAQFNVDLPLSYDCDSSSGTPGESANPLLSGFKKSDVFHLGITELYHRTLPCIGQKSQDHITVCFCVSASGEKEIIGLVFSENACVEGELWNVNVPCFSSPMGQATLEVYHHSLNVLNQKMGQSDRKILLYVDDSQFPAEIERDMSNIEIRTWPWMFNIQEIINNYRLLYCQRLMSSLAASSLNHWNRLGLKVKNLPMSKVMKLVQSAWKDVSSRLIELSFQCNTVFTDRDSQCQAINNKLLEEIQKLVLVLKSSKENVTSPILEVSKIEEMLSQDSIDENSKDFTHADEGEESDSVPFDQQDTVCALNGALSLMSKTEVLPTLSRLELFLESMTESPARQNALDLLDKLERAVQDLLITDKAGSTEDGEGTSM
ncbi:uncharacterized protein LOC117646499 [Thrips palmi]|uniref:Uncharacterized protein LOC117646499 n=1 Tax=Thrips palmi TaxID=161013 RepID=A0A6P8Z8S1_THRPL|nr:uncharacterized protein LOC117646499 [Thrips palmi]XP_034243393.1 uncharacterized protein LOC117646499 [Thrips palmi]